MVTADGLKMEGYMLPYLGDCDLLWLTTVAVPIRLIGGPSAHIGRVQVSFKGQWGYVCNNSFDDNEARSARYDIA